MHGSRSLEPMNIRQKFREGAEPISKKSLHPTNQHDEYTHESDSEQDVVPFWEQNLDESIE